MAKQVQSSRPSTPNYTSGGKSNKRAKKQERAISIIQGMDDARLDALLLILDPPAEDDYEFTEEDKLIINERTARYESGEDKGIPSDKMVKELRARLRRKK
ncbi:MAG TPA: hypothetical protein VK826_12785 [Bacteroidia bacterium]|nr:hypothetical protein [Bacteroidia bacterium]